MLGLTYCTASIVGDVFDDFGSVNFGSGSGDGGGSGREVVLEKGFVEGEDGFELDAECYLVGWVDHVGGCSYISVGVLGPCVDRDGKVENRRLVCCYTSLPGQDGEGVLESRDNASDIFIPLNTRKRGGSFYVLTWNEFAYYEGVDKGNPRDSGRKIIANIHKRKSNHTAGSVGIANSTCD